MKRAAILLCFILLISPIAASFEERFSGIDTVIDFDEVATYNLSLTNDENEPKTVRLSLNVDDSTSWILSPSTVRIPAQSTVSQVIKLSPRVSAQGGAYFVEIRLITNEEEKMIGAPVSLGAGDREFLPSVGLFVRNDEEIDPRESFELNIELKNRNQREYDNLALTVSSDLFQTAFNMSLEGLAQEGRNLFIPIDKTTRPGTYDLEVTLRAPDRPRAIASFDTTFDVVPYSEVRESVTTNESLFKTTRTVTLQNDGNVENEYIFTTFEPLFDRFFVSSNEEYFILETEDSSQLAWNVTIPPQGEASVTYTENYRPLAVFFLVVIVSVVLYYLLRSPVVITKEAHIVDDGNNTVRVRVHVRNRSRQDVYNVTVRDKLKGILKYKEKDEVGYISPTYAKKQKDGSTRLRWDLNTLDSLEERVFVYEANPSLDVIGSLDLDRSEARFEDEKGNVRITTSRGVSVGEKYSFLPSS